MGKGKGKATKKATNKANPAAVNKGKAAKIATPTVKSPVKEDNTKSSVTSRANFSQDLSCGLCNMTNEVGQWFVQCDDCDEHFHFNCVGITEIYEEDPWSCGECLRKKQEHDLSRQVVTESKDSHADAPMSQTLPTLTQSSNINTSSAITRSEQRSHEMITSIEVHEEPVTTKVVDNSDISHVNLDGSSVNANYLTNIHELTTPTQYGRQSLAPTSHFKTVGLNDKKTSTRAASINPRINTHPAESSLSKAHSKTPSSSSKTRSSRSSQRRSDNDIERIEAELDLQTRLDEERLAAELAIKLEAVRLKEIRERKFLEDKYMEKSIRGGSVRSQNTVKTNRTSYVSNWIEDQQKCGKSKSVDDNIRQKSLNQFDASKVEKSRQQGKAMSADGHTMRQLKKIDEFNFDWSITLDVEERDQLTQLLRKSTMTPAGTAQRSEGERSIEHSGKLKASAPIFVPNPQEPTNVTQSKPPRYSALDNTIPTNTQQPIVSKIDKTCDATIKGKYQNQSMLSCTQVDSSWSQSHTSTINSNHFVNNQATIHNQTRADIYGHRPIMSTTTANHQTQYNTSAQQNQTIPIGTGYHESSRPPVFVTQATNPSTTNWQEYQPSQLPQNSQQEYVRPMLTTNQIAARHAIPKELPKFKDHTSNWLRFIKRYENSTLMCGYSNDENLERLDKCLEGTARTIVESQLTIPDSVPEIIETLRQRYGRPELVVKLTLADIRKEQSIKPNNLEALSDYGYKVRNVYKTIESQRMYYYLHDPELLRELVDKLPHQTKIDWARHSETLPMVTLVTFSNWLYTLSQSLNRIITPGIITNSIESKPEKKPDHKSDNHKSGHINVHNNQGAAVDSSKCSICNMGCKSVEECSKFKGLVVDERWKSVITNNLCRMCFKKKHRRSCHKSKECGVNGCAYKHHPLLHNDQRHSKENQRQNSQSSSGKQEKFTSSNGTAVNRVSSGSNNTHIVVGQEELFRIVPVVLHHNDRSLKTFAFLDEGSSFTLMERGLADELNLMGTPETICLIWTKKVHRQEQSQRVELEISGIDQPNNRYRFKSVNLVDNLDLPLQSVSPTALARRFGHLKDLPLVEYQNAAPRLLIGLKHARLTTPLETIEGKGEGPIATRSRLGWSVHGPMNGDETVGYVNIHRVKQCPCKGQDEDTHQIIKDHFSIENFGVRANSMSINSKEDERAIELLRKHTIRKNDRFETRLLWKNESCILPDSLGMAYNRLNCLENKGPAVIKIIDDTIQDYMNKGYVSKLTQAEADKIHPRKSYLPIFTVINPKKPKKIRPVFDAAAKVKGVSLNSVLLTGPDLLSPIVDVLRRFREHRIAVSGDIKEMYHQVLVNKEDRDAQRFLWRNGNKEKAPDVYVMNVMTFGATCSPSIAQYVKNVNASEFQQKFPRAAKAIIENHYVDDMMDGAENVEDAVKLIEEVKFIHKQAGFEIRNFISNSEQVLKAIGESNGGCKKDLIEDCMKTERVLGMFWDTSLDCFIFSLKFTKVTSEMLTGKKLPTKRELLKLVMSIFDPLGLLAYYLIHAKILLQDVWRSKIGWDDRLPEHLRENWDRWIKLLPMVEKLQVPRWYSEKLSSNVNHINELHIFVDAGGEAFSAAAYLRIEDEHGCDCSLIGSKARVTPLKYLSTPRKELMGGVLGSRLVNSVQSGMSVKIDRRVIWTDSRTLLIWLHSESRKYSQFVGHRVGEILENTNLDEWRWVPSKMNVADEATKWNKKPTFESTDRWFTGPAFLKLPESEWPLQETIVPNGTQEEMRFSCTHSQLILPSIVNPADVSRWKRILRGLAYAIRFSKIIIAKCRKLPLPKGPLSQKELMESERRLFQQAQWEGFTDEMLTLTRNQRLETNHRKSITKDSPIRDCSPYLDEDGTLRVKGRIDSAAAVTIDAKRPIILPRHHKITKLIVHHYHQKFAHRNHESVINELKQRFYIPQIRTVLKSVRWHCALCKIRRCKPNPPQMADLPAVRFEPGIRAFTYTGIDYFGPMYVKVGRQRHKRWGVLLTCLTIRAIHIEIAYSLTTESCILSIRNFVARKGRPIHIYSDNGSNLKGADNELTKELRKLDVHRLGTEFTSSYTSWIFIPPASPHMGGCWERLIRTVKSCLKDSMTTRTPSDEVLRSLLMESENIVNSRPLTFIPIDSEAMEALTPNHFLLGSSNGLKPPGEFRNDGPYLRSAWKEVQRCTNIFWQRFIHEYVPTLTRRTKWFDMVKPIEVGDLVINFDETNSRNTYTKARVKETIVGSNGQVRRARIQESDGKQFWRPATLLGVLDVSNPTPTASSLEASGRTLETGGRTVGATNSNFQPEEVSSQNQTFRNTKALNASTERQVTPQRKRRHIVKSSDSEQLN